MCEKAFEFTLSNVSKSSGTWRMWNDPFERQRCCYLSFFPGFYQTTCILKSDLYTIIDTNAHGKQKRVMQVKNLTSSEHTGVGKS